MLKLKMLAAVLAISFVSNSTKATDSEAVLVKANHLFISPTAPGDGIIIKSVNECTFQLINECGETVHSGKLHKGVNEISLKNLPVASYKLLVNGSSFSTERKLSIR